MKEIKLTKWETTDGKVHDRKGEAEIWQDIIDDPKKRFCPRCNGKGITSVCVNCDRIRDMEEHNMNCSFNGATNGFAVIPEPIYEPDTCPACNGRKFQVLKGITEPKEVWE